jgi:hypothetical protein
VGRNRSDQEEWQTVYGRVCAAIYLIVTAMRRHTWPATDFVYEGGGIL